MHPQKQARDYVWELTGGDRGGVRGERGEKMKEGVGKIASQLVWGLFFFIGLKPS